MGGIRAAVPRSRIGLGVAFGVVVVGLALVDALVVVEVEPQLEGLRQIANDHASALEATTRIRARVSTARRDLLGAVNDRARGETRGGAGAAGELAAIQADTDALLALADTPAERAGVEALRERLVRCAEEAQRIEALLAQGDGAGARLRLESFHSLAHRASDAADRIVALNAREVEELSRGIRVELRWTVLAATVVTFVGGASALLLLRRALRGLAGEEAAASARSSELEAFAARAAHELRAPLQTVSLALHALERGSGPAALEKALRSTERLRETVDGLLEFARAGVAPSERGSADLRRVLGDVEDELAPHLASAQVSMQVDVPPGTTVAMATSHLATVMRNLVGNAAKYAGGGAGARVTVRATPARGGVHVEVADNGPGIPADALPRVFEPFVRATAAASGHGLGLATVRRLVEAHRGKVHISSAPGHGTTVELELPRPEAPGADHASG